MLCMLTKRSWPGFLDISLFHCSDNTTPGIKSTFEGKYSPEAIKEQYIHAYDTFSYILVLEGFTRGGGDGDKNSDDDEDLIEKKMTLAQLHGVAIGGLTSKTYQKWQNNGWYELFADQ